MGGYRFEGVVLPYHGVRRHSLETGFHMIATIVAIAEKKSSSAIVVIDGFQMIAAIVACERRRMWRESRQPEIRLRSQATAIATIAEKVNEDSRGTWLGQHR